MYRIAEKTRSLLLATATPVQLRPIEAWDLLDVLGRGDESVLGNTWSRWRNTPHCLDMIMELVDLPENVTEQWEWVRNPLPPKAEHWDFEVLRRRLDLSDVQSVVPGNDLDRLRPPDRARLSELFPRFVREHHPFIRRIVRRTRGQLESQIDPETNEPLLQKIGVRLLGEAEREAVRLPPYLQEAYELAEEFCATLGRRMKAAGFLKTLLLRRVGSSIHAGLKTAEKMLADWDDLEEDIDEEDEAPDEAAAPAGSEFSRSLTAEERGLLTRFVEALRANQERDPKYAVVRQCLLDRGWLRLGCIVFSQYRDSIQWLAGVRLDRPAGDLKRVLGQVAGRRDRQARHRRGRGRRVGYWLELLSEAGIITLRHNRHGTLRQGRDHPGRPRPADVLRQRLMRTEG